MNNTIFQLLKTGIIKGWNMPTVPELFIKILAI